MGDDLYADVVVLPPIPGREILTYSVPGETNGCVDVGARVLVPVANRRAAGVVVAVRASRPKEAIGIKLKPVTTLLDAEPTLSREVVDLCRWAAHYYCAALAELVSAALPAGLKVSTERRLQLSGPVSAQRARSLGQRERILLEKLAGGRTLSSRALRERGAGVDLRHAVSSLQAKGIVTVREKTRGSGGKRARDAWLQVERQLEPLELERLRSRCPAQYRLYSFLRERGRPVPRAEVAEMASASVREGLVRKGMASMVHSLPPAGEELMPSAGPALTSDQQVATEAICAEVGRPSFSVFLLHGVTGSGKTEVYLRAAQFAVTRHRSVLFLVPEIGLTHQLAQRIRDRFPGQLAILHSGLPQKERLAQWQRIARGEARVVVGARSAVFAPAAGLGLVIVDEEHDTSYKQEEAPRYSARDLAIVRAQKNGCPVILGSATPSLESYQRAVEGRYRLLTLPRRVMERGMPRVEVIDLRQAGYSSPGPRSSPQDGSEETSLLSPALASELERALEAGEQSLLFLNRRGFASYLQCVRCGEPVSCPNCSVTLTLHAGRRILLCHHCNHSRPPLVQCPACREEALRPLGGGTELIEESLTRLLPAARIERLDRDTTSKRGSLEAILARWESHEIDILIGTQMVTKGHDIPGVTLVGVVLADVALGMPDFRASERTFQLLAQVAGRAGRGSQPGKVMVQTFRPTHPSIRAAQTHDYEAFSRAELAERRSLGYPPFGRLALVRAESRQPEAAERAAAGLGDWCRNKATRAVQVTGPAPAPLERLRGMYRWHLMLRSSSRPQLGRLVSQLPEFWRRSAHRRVCRLVIDVDPLSML